MSSPALRALRGVGGGRVLVGILTLVAVGRDGVPIFDSLPPRALAAARVLAVRDLVQGASLVLAPESRVGDAARVGSFVDGLHASTLLPLVAFSPRYRPGAMLSVASALAWITVTSIARRSRAA